MTNDATPAVPARSTTEPFDVIANAHEMFDAKKYKEAAALLLTLQDAPEFTSRSVQELLARSYYHSAQLTKAADTARSLLQGDPTNVDAAVLLTRSLERAGKKDDADAARRVATSLGATL